MGIVLIVLGIVLWLTISPLIGLICFVIGLILLFVPYDGAYGYSRWRGRRGPP